MRKQLFILSVILVSANCAFAQITFQKTYGGSVDDKGYAVQQTTDGGYILAGFTQSFGTGPYDAYLIKTDGNGDSLWTKSFGGSGNEEFHFVEQTTDGGFIAAGQGDFGAGNIDVYLVKTNSGGDTLWTKTFGGTGDDVAQSVHQTSDGGYVITGNTNSFSLGIDDVYLIKTDSNGTSVWEKTYGDTANIDNGNSIEQNVDGGYIITGQTFSFTGETNVLLIKTNSNGDTLWTKSYSRLTYTPDIGNSVRQTIDSGYIIAGNTLSTGGAGYDGYLIKTDASGDTIWTRTYGGMGLQEFNSVQLTTDGGYIITGQTSYGGANMSVFLVKTNFNGDTLWTKAYGTPGLDWGNSIQRAIDGGYIIIGQSMMVGLGWDFYLIKTDSLGNSGCNQTAAPFIIASPPFQIINPSIMVTSSASITTYPATIVGSGGFVNTYCTSVGLNEIPTDNSFIVSPNPSSGTFTISFERRIINGNVEIVNILGENVFAKRILNESKKEINQQNISSGIYFVKVYDGQKYYCKKIIIEQN